MGTQDISIATDPESRKKFLRYLLTDVEAFEKMLKEGMIESGKKRIGAEQEFCLVNRFFKPSKLGPEILEHINDGHFTTELARFNLELNLKPLTFTGDCLRKMESELHRLMAKAEESAAKFGNYVILSGILPSVDFQSVQMSYLTPRERYRALADVLKQLREGDFELNISGVDEMIVTHQNILFEACNTSFQCHYQVDPGKFTAAFNWAQAIAGPVLSACANSPLLIGRQLWAETRIPLFQQSIDTRGKGFHLREKHQRVTFGNRWIREPADAFKSDIARHTVLFLTDIETGSLEILERGEIPKLQALMLHNGTIYKWNRPCYGVSGNVAHVRIENRYIPSGPTIRDEVANLAFWSGLMNNMPKKYRKIWKHMKFDDAKENFYKAAMWGIQSGMVWDNGHISARRLIRDILVPMAREGLQEAGIDGTDIAEYLSVIEQRALKYQTGARWAVKSFRKLKEFYERDEASVALTAVMYARRKSGLPVHDWKIASVEEVKKMNFSYDVVSNVMSTDLITVTEHDLIDLLLKIMEWRKIRHLPVEDHKGRLLGMIYQKKLLDFVENANSGKLLTAADVMETDVVTVSPDTDIETALNMISEQNHTCLPVIENDRLVGIFTDFDANKIWIKKERNGKKSGD